MRVSPAPHEGTYFSEPHLHDDSAFDRYHIDHGKGLAGGESSKISGWRTHASFSSLSKVWSVRLAFSWKGTRSKARGQP